MSAPENPNTVVLKNKYYPSGLTEGKVWNYYDKNRKKIINEINGRLAALFLSTDFRNDLVVIRRKGNKYFTIDDNNYDKMISGRTISICVEQGKMCDYWLIDIDPLPSSTEQEKKIVLEDVLNFVKMNSNISDIRVTMTAESYHVYGYLKKRTNISSARKHLEYLLKYYFKDKYYVNKKDKKDKFNLDLSTMTPRGFHTVVGALNRNGLICLDVTNNWKNIKRENARL